MTRLAVLADPHCDDYGSKLDPATGLNARWIDTVDMVRWVAADAQERGCAGLIVAGDLTEARHPAPWRVAQISAALESFQGAEVLVRGNHDGVRAGKSIVDVIAAGRRGWMGFTSPGVTLVDDVAIAVMPFLDRRHARALPGFEAAPDADLTLAMAGLYLNVASGLYVQAKALAPAAVLVVHQALAGGLMSDTQAAFLGDQGLVVDTRALAAIGFEAILAGHFHKHQVLSTEPLVAYAGSPYRTDFGEEHQPKGYLVVDVETGRAMMEFVETPARRFVTLTGADLRVGLTEDQIADAVVRVIDVDPTDDVSILRRELEHHGAFDVQEIRVRPLERLEVAGGIAEGLSAHQALVAYFADDADADALVERGRGILAEIAA